MNDPFLESLDEWVWEMDTNGIHTYSNRAVEKILGYKVEEVIGFSTTKLWADSSVKNNLSILQKSLEKGEGWRNFPAYFQHKNGQIKILESSAIPVYDENNQLAGYRGIDRDITSHKQNENELKTKQQHVKLINKILRHDLSNNLNVINSVIRLQERGYEIDICKEIKRVLDKSFLLIKNMTELENFMQTNWELKIYDSQKVIESLISKAENIRFEIEGTSQILADEMIYSVFENLISNAISHGKADMIRFEISKSGYFSQINVIDNGKGIPDNIKEKIFEEGFSYGQNGKTGIGLFIVKDAMERYGGKICIKDNLPQGAVFELSFKCFG